MRKLLILLLIFLFAGSCVFAQGEPNCTLENDHMKRVIITDHGVRTNIIVNKLTGKEYPVTSSGFRLLLDGGLLELRSSDFEVISHDITESECSYEMENKNFGVHVIVTYDLQADNWWSRKWIDVESPAHVVNEIEVERFRLDHPEVRKFDEEHESKPPWHWAGGRPLFVDGQLFMGLEYPAGYNEEFDNLFLLHHYPGRKGKIISKTAVIGVSWDRPNDRVEDAFARYLDTVRYRPPRRFILWNGYFHKFNAEGGPADTHNLTFLKNKFEKGRKAFIDVGVKPDCVLIDGGWTDPRSLMEEDHRAPERLAQIKSLSAKYLDAPIGVHVITHGIRDSIDKGWLAENFDMIDDKAYCFADPRAVDLEIDNLLDIMGRYHPKAFKFDWGRYTCKQKGHSGHLDGERYAREAITDNQIRMLTALHQADPEAFLYNTGWFSPWWLMHYEAVFSGEDDFNNALTGPPSFYTNDLLVTWRDAVIRRNIVLPETQFPLEALMNHSPISWGWTRDYFKPGHGSLESFTNMILMNYLRGNGLIELFANVYNLSKDEREVWGSVTKWVKAHDDILLASSKFLGGDPFKGEIYGYAHFNDSNRGIIGIRNPAVLPADFSFKLDEKIGFKDNGMEHRLRISYPYEVPIGSSFRYGDTVRVSLERGQVLVIESARVNDDGALSEMEVMIPQSFVSAQARQASKEETPLGMKGKYYFTVPNGVTAELVIMAKLPSYEDQKNVSLDLTVNGEPAQAQRTENCSGKDKPTFGYEPSDGWVIYTIPLAFGTSEIEFDLTAPGAEPWGWLMTETPPDGGLSLFNSGLPSMWATETKSEVKLF